MKKSYTLLATIALALSLNSVAAWAVEKSDGKPKNEKSPNLAGNPGNHGKSDTIKIMEHIHAQGSSPDCRTGGGGGL